MRLAVDVMPLLGPGTGVATFTRGLVRELGGRADVELVAYALSFTGRSAVAGVVPTGAKVVRRPMAAGPLLRVWERWRRPPIEWWTGRIDAVHGPNYVVPPSRSARRVVSVHDLTSVRFPHLCAPASLRYPRLVQRAVDSGAVVHTDSDAIRAEVVDLLGVDPSRVVTVYPGVDPAPPVEPRTAERYVLALGAIEPRKNLPALVRAFDTGVAPHVDDVRLVIAGADAWGADAVATAIGAARHRARIDRLGRVDDTERAALVAGAAVFAYPSIYEGFGFPPLEAMSAGVPVVASRAGSLPEVLGDAALLVDPHDEAAIAAAIVAALDDPAGLVERGRANAKRFSWAGCAERLVAVYRGELP